MKKRILAVFAIMLLTMSIFGCSNSASKEKKVVLASKPMTEQYIIGEILAELITSNSDIEVEKNFGIGGGTSNIHPAMEKGEIDIYPEYTGTGWLAVLQNEPIKDGEELFQSVKEQYESKYGIYWSNIYGFDNTYSLAVRRDVAEKYNLETFEDLQKVSNEIVIGANPDFYEREDGFKGLSEAYGFEFKGKEELDISLRYKAIESSQVDVIPAFNTDPKVKEYDLVLLKDNKNYFQSYHAATLVRGEVLEKYPELKDILAKLDGQISDEEMLQMNYKVEILNEDPHDVALKFIEEKQLR